MNDKEKAPSSRVAPEVLDTAMTWLRALGALENFNEGKPDAKPLADLLRSGRPVPPGIAYAIAEMLDPTDEDVAAVRFDAVPVRSSGKSSQRFQKAAAVAVYAIMRSGGASEQDALAEAQKYWSFTDKSNFHAERRKAENRKKKIIEKQFAIIRGCGLQIGFTSED